MTNLASSSSFRKWDFFGDFFYCNFHTPQEKNPNKNKNVSLCNSEVMFETKHHIVNNTKVWDELELESYMKPVLWMFSDVSTTDHVMNFPRK